MGRPSLFSEEIAEIYALRDPRTGDIRYIGKANCAAKRLSSHMRDSKRRDTPVYRWIRKLGSLGLHPQLTVLLSVPHSQWEAAEIVAISKAKEMGCRLLNVALGGDQPLCPTAVRAQNGRNNAAAIHAMHANPKRKEMWRLLKNLGTALKRGYVSDSAKRKILARPDVFGGLIRLIDASAL